MKIFWFLTFFEAKSISILLTYITVNNDIIIHIANNCQNHFIIFIPKMKSITATTNQVIWLSQIADQDLLNQVSIDLEKLCHKANSSLILSKTRILASIAIPTERISQAIEARVNTIEKTFTIAKTTKT